MIRLAKTSRGVFAVRVLVGRVVSTQTLTQPVVDGDRALAGLSCTRLVFEHEGATSERCVVHLEPLDIVPHRVLTLVTGCEAHIEWPLYIYSPGDRSHQRFDEHIRWFLNSVGGEPMSEVDQRVIWSAILLQVLPG